MQVLSVNVGQRRTQAKGNALETTGIYKIPVSGSIPVGREGIEQDFICDLKNHGGPDQAVYVYGAEDYAWWWRELGQVLEPGTFGENLTVSDLESSQLLIGDRLRVGTVVLEVTAPRIPCSTLAARMGNPEFVRGFRDAERPGAYCRVIQTGTVRAGDEIARTPYAGDRVSILEVFRDHYNRKKVEAGLRRLLGVPISIRARASLESELKKLLAAPGS